MGRARREFLLVGDGLLLGVAAGFAVCFPEVFSNRLLHHGTHWLAAERLADGMATGAGCGLLASTALIVFLRLAFPTLASRNGRPGRWRLANSVVAAAGIAASVSAVGFWLASPVLARHRAAGHPPVILVSIDTMRGDRLNSTRGHEAITPHLDRLGREGVVFESATAVAPWTLPSHVSIFTSLLPFDHGVRHIGSRIPGGLSLVSEHFRNAGYRTAAFTGGGYVSWGYGFDQGFEVYEDHDEKAEGGPVGITAAAVEWVKSVQGEPFFLFVHTYEPHHPYDHDDFADPGDAGRLATDDGPGENIQQPTETERRYMAALYDSDVAHADRVFGKMLETFREEGILDRGILVVLSDHGEDLWDHDAVSIPRHGHTLYQELLDVPLLVRAPGLVAAGLRVRTPVSLLDVAPTMLELAGLPGAGSFRGRSLAESCRTGVEPEMMPIISESTRYGPDRLAMRQGDFKLVFTPHPDRIREPQYTYRPAAPVEIFDLRADPLERFDRSRDGVVLPSGMVETLTERVSTHLRDSEENVGSHPPDLIEQLRSLGYVQ